MMAEKGTAAISPHDDFEFTLPLPSCLAQKKLEHQKKNYQNILDWPIFFNVCYLLLQKARCEF
jgi:hypothetical protein